MVEWEAPLREQLAAVAGECGFEATSCTTPEEARNLLEATDFDGLLFDAELYGESTSGFLAWLGGLGERKPYVIALSDGGAAHEPSEWLRQGADDILYKPVAGDALRARLALMEARGVERARRADELAKVRRNHGRFESLFLEAPDAILILKNRQGKVIGVNRAVKDVLGYGGKSLLGKFMSLVFPDIFGRDGLASRGDVLSGATMLHAVPYRKPDGERRYLDISMSAVPWDKGFAVMMVCRDVTGREGAEGGRIQSMKEEALGKFAAGVSRDFGDLLTSLGGNLSLLESAPFLNDEARETIALAQDSCERGRELTSELAALSGRRRRNRPGRVELRRMVEKAVQFSLFDFEAVRPVFRHDENLSAVEADEAQLRMVVEVLATNAAQAIASTGGGGQLAVELANVAIGRSSELPLREGDYVRLSVRDDGPGMGEADLRQVFDPYFSGREGGRGFGLTRALAAVRSCGGHIEARSQPGEGACFEVFLPAVEEVARPVPGGAGDGGAGRAAMRVLVLDDEPHIRTVLEKVLGGAGHDIYSAATGEEALRAFYKADDFGRPFDVLLFDLDIRGGMGGRQTLERIRATHPGVRAIVTTGFVDDEVLENYLEHGFSGVLCKPFRVEHLTAAIERLGRGVVSDQ